MANKKITELTEITSIVDTDLFLVVSDPSGTASSRKILKSNLGFATETNTLTMSNKTLTSPVINTGISGTAIVDEDNMASDSATKVPTQQSVKAYADAITTSLTAEIEKTAVSLYVVDGTTDLTTGDGKIYFTIPSHLNGLVISAVHARVITAGTTGTTDIQIANVTDAVDVLSTKLTIDSTETNSSTAATPYVINTSNDDVATNDLFRVDIDSVSTTAPKGLIVRIEFS